MEETEYVEAFYSGTRQPPSPKFIFSLIFSEYQIWIEKNQQRLSGVNAAEIIRRVHP